MRRTHNEQMLSVSSPITDIVHYESGAYSRVSSHPGRRQGHPFEIEIGLRSATPENGNNSMTPWRLRANQPASYRILEMRRLFSVVKIPQMAGLFAVVSEVALR